MPVSEEREIVNLTVNGETVEAEKGELVIAAAERAGTYIPHFCYHPRMASVGMCRMCIVDIDSGRGPALQPACMIEVAPDMVVDTHSEATQKAQDGVLEFLLINHPLDCPVCDKGGECPLQDQTMAYGPGESRFVEEKRHYAKPIPVNDIVLLDRERCILCDRCTRFAKDVAGDPLISFIGRGASTQVNTFPDHPFSSYFSGNTVQICPVGALTAGPFRFRARPWDMAQAESTCTTCAVGCRVAIQTSRDDVLRYSGVDVDPVNWGWLCDKGRFDFSVVNHPDRLGEPLVRTPGGSGLTTTRWSEALTRAADALEAAPADRIGVIGGARLTNEAAYAWAKLAKGVLGTDNVDAQLGDGLPADLVLGLPKATIDEACAPGTTVVLLGPDIKEELGVLYLRLRHAAVEDGVRIVEIAPAVLRPQPVRRPHRAARPGWGARRGPVRDRRRPPGRRPGRGPPRPPVAGRGRQPHRPGRPGPGRPRGPGPLPVHPAPGQRPRRPRHGPGPRPAARSHPARRRRATPSPPPGRRCPPPWAWTPRPCCGPRPTAASTCSSCSGPTRSRTPPTATWPAGPWRARARSSPWTCSSPLR